MATCFYFSKKVFKIWFKTSLNPTKIQVKINVFCGKISHRRDKTRGTFLWKILPFFRNFQKDCKFLDLSPNKITKNLTRSLKKWKLSTMVLPFNILSILEWSQEVLQQKGFIYLFILFVYFLKIKKFFKGKMW